MKVIVKNIEFPDQTETQKQSEFPETTIEIEIELTMFRSELNMIIKHLLRQQSQGEK